MIFRRGKKKGADEPAAEGAPPPEDPGVEPDLGDVDAHDEAREGDSGTLDVAALDARDWRGSGPYDISEVDLDEEPEEGDARIDLGSMILTAFAGSELRLQVSEESGQVISAMLVHGNSALELGAFAAPRSGGLWSELREEMSDTATEAGGSASLVEGPFGVELRRLLPVTTPEGEEGYQPSRMWVVEGPRWLLRGIVYGQAALEEGLEAPVAELLTAYRRVIVRRGDEAMAPGDLLPLTMPENLVRSEPDTSA